MYNEENIKNIIQKLEKSDDDELKVLVLGLIDEMSKLIDLANIDPLTGVYNRRVLDRIRKCDIALMCDIDDFKIINDTHGHDIGDLVLKKLALILKENTRINDYVIRLGGDEFLVVFTDCEYNFIKDRCEKIKQKITNEMKLLNFGVTISIGISLNTNNNSLEEMITCADKALYESKNNGKNLISIYNK